jgi:hypothetical protein
LQPWNGYAEARHDERTSEGAALPAQRVFVERFAFRERWRGCREIEQLRKV